MPGSQTTRGGANPRAGGPAPIAFCCHDGIGTPDYIAFAAHNLACTHPCQRFAGNLAALTHDSGPVWDATPFTVMDSHLQPPAGLPAHRGSMAGLYAPLPTLRRRPRGRPRTAWGRCGSLFLHRSGLSPHTPCRSPGALTRVAARTLAPSPICDPLYRRLQPFRHLHDCSGCFRLERSPGGACTHWKAPPSHGAHVLLPLRIATANVASGQVSGPCLARRGLRPERRSRRSNLKTFGMNF